MNPNQLNSSHSPQAPTRWQRIKDFPKKIVLAIALFVWNFISAMIRTIGSIAEKILKPPIDFIWRHRSKFRRFLIPMGIAIGAGWLWFGVIIPRLTSHTDKRAPNTIALAITATILLLVLLAMLGFIWIIFKYVLPAIGIKLGKKASVVSTATVSSSAEKKPKQRSGLRKLVSVVIRLSVISLLLFMVLPWAIRTWWPRAGNQPAMPTLLSVRAGNACRDKESGKQVVFDHASTSETDFDAYIFPGCDTLVAVPKVYGYHWYVGLADDPDAHRYVYLKEQGASQYRLYDLSSENNADMHWQSLRIYFQSAEKGGTKVHFHTDLEPVTLEKAGFSSVPMPTVSPLAEIPIFDMPNLPCTDEVRRILSGKKAKSAKLNFGITVKGDIVGVVIIESTGISALDDKVKEFVGNDEFEPITRNGLPVPVPLAEAVVRIPDDCHE
jgi:hypothetical protein